MRFAVFGEPVAHRNRQPYISTFFRPGRPRDGDEVIAGLGQRARVVVVRIILQSQRVVIGPEKLED